MRRFVDGSLTGTEWYRLLTSLIVPRPIALVTTLNDRDASVNLAPFSFFTGVGSNPPSLVISVTSGGRDKPIKDTLRNCERPPGEFVVNAAQEQYAASVNAASTELPYGESELPLTSLSLRPSHAVGVPSVAEADWTLECVVHALVQVGERGTTGAATLVVGRIVAAQVRESVLRLGDKAGFTDMDQVKPLARLGGNRYCGVREPFSMNRPSKKKVTEE